MARLEITLKGENIQAEKVVKMAQVNLKLLRSVEKHLMAEKGLPWKDRTPWYIDITTASHCVHIMLRSPEAEMAWGSDTLKEMNTVLQKAIAASGAAEGGHEVEVEVR